MSEVTISAEDILREIADMQSDMTAEFSQIRSAMPTSIDYTEVLDSISTMQYELTESVAELRQSVDVANTYLGHISGFALFLVVCALCVAVYKFLRWLF